MGVFTPRKIFARVFLKTPAKIMTCKNHELRPKKKFVCGRWPENLMRNVFFLRGAKVNFQVYTDVDEFVPS